MAIGQIGPLNAAEARDAEAYNLQERPIARAWEYWTLRLGDRANFPKGAKTASRTRPAASRKKAKAVSKRRR
jgi:hypothetical protein